MPRASMRGPWNGYLARRRVHQLPSRELFDKVWIDRSRFEKRDAMLQSLPLTRLVIKRRLAHAECCARIFQSMQTTRAENEVIPKVKNCSATYGGNDERPKETAYASLDSHGPNESRGDSPRQAKIARSSR